MGETKTEAVKEKKSVALLSVFAALLITAFKIIVGVMTGSLGIISEALHSALDLIAAGITYLAVNISDKPADDKHHYGHGKIENYSALIETLLLFITSFWIIYEALRRLITNEVEIEVNAWAFIVIITSIIVDISRSRALKKAAVKHNSQALEADALHFSTDIWSSTVVLIGLIGASFNFFYADAIAGLAVAIIVLGVSYRLGKRSFDALIDRAPEGLYEKIYNIVNRLPDVIESHDIKIRESGPYKFVDINIHVKSQLSIKEAHEISHRVEKAITEEIKNITVMVHAEPEGHSD
ncbi:cation diffusion facilitator family transporter [Melioribacter roseus P3M-2]|uniref:Cation diffusion facilitator family transporter n=1 Tax=Melioribacter roseus (strain DSM 23840 / JCM 17771 / VKM B-2668 / P3M-2) TaxID=1191523 RepID=I7A2F0_MELRP|nr:cation diffusion facilitator family transporter [Melioribacter roseus]AFN74101.1 cation diffusion facilitator family transporter [Melioribacter roseus P3M-2]